MLASLLGLAIIGHVEAKMSLPCVSRREYKASYEQHLEYVGKISSKKLNKSFRGSVSMYRYQFKGQGVVLKYYHLKKTHVSRTGFREAIVLNKLKNLKHVVKFEFCVKTSAYLKIFVEELQYTLADALPLFRSQPIKVQIQALIDVTNTFHALHKIERIHGDIKPSNFMLEKHTLVMKIIDFGYAVHLGNLIEGYSPVYIPPECGRSLHAIEAHITQDVWSWVLNIFVILFPDFSSMRLYRYPNGVLGFNADDTRLVKRVLEAESLRHKLPFDAVMMKWIRESSSRRPSMKKIAYELNSILVGGKQPAPYKSSRKSRESLTKTGRKALAA